MRGVAWDLKRRYATALLAGSSAKDRLLELIKRHNGWNFARELWDFTYALDLVGQTSTFTCAATARTCWGYVGDPAAGNPPRLITGIPADVQAIVGGRWNGAKFLTTDTSGNTLNPFIKKSTPAGTIKVFTAYPTYAVSTAYAAGVQVAILTTAGNRVYMQSSGGTSDAAAVVIADSDIGGAVVADNDINWSVLGYATGLAEQLEVASENELLNSDAPATQTTASLAIGVWTLQVFGSGSALISAGTAIITGEAACTEGAPNTISVTGAGTVTVTVTGALDYFQLEAGTFPSSIIITAATTLARAATLLTDTTAGRLSAESGAGRIVVNPSAIDTNAKWLLSTQVDANNYFGIISIAGVSIRLQKYASGAVNATEVYTAVADTPFIVEFYYNLTDGMAIRAYSVGDSAPAWETNANIDLAKIAATFEVGSIGGASHFTFDAISCELDTDKARLNFE